MLNKRFHPANFAFTERFCGSSFRIGDQTFTLDTLATRDDIFHLSIRNTHIWRHRPHQPTLRMLKNTSPELIGKHSIMTLGANGAITLTTQQGARILQSPPRQSFGVCGTAWLFV